MLLGLGLTHEVQLDTQSWENLMLQYIAIQLRARTSERGATAVEYGLLVALIAAVIVTVVVFLGQNVNDGFTAVNNELP